MLEVKGMTAEEVREKLRLEIEARCAIAFAAGCRLAVSEIRPPQDPMRLDITSILFGGPDAGDTTLHWDFVVLSPGEAPPDGSRWTIYEDRSGIPVGRET